MQPNVNETQLRGLSGRTLLRTAKSFHPNWPTPAFKSFTSGTGLFKPLWSICTSPDGDAEEVAQIWDAVRAFINPAQPVILMGDFNGVEDPRMDRGTYSRTLTPGERVTRDKRLDLDLVDVYRETHPDSKEYSFSRFGDHQSRIDRFLVSRDILANVSRTGITQYQHNDHEPIFIDIRSGPSARQDNQREQVIHRTRYKYPPGRKDTDTPLRWVAFQENVERMLSGPPQNQPIDTIERLEQEAIRLQTTLETALESVFGRRTYRQDNAPHRSKRASKLRKEIRLNSKITYLLKQNRRSVDPTVQARILQKVVKATGTRRVNWDSAFGVMMHHRTQLVTQLDKIVKEERRISAAQEAAARIAELERSKGYQRYSASVQPSAKLSAVQTQDGGISTDPNTVREAVRETWGNLLGVAPVCDRANDGPWQREDLQHMDLNVSETFVEGDIRQYLLNVPLNKAPDLLGINATVLWYSPPSVLQRVADIFTAILRLQHLPSKWNTTWTTLLYKSGPQTVVTNYRPISIVNFFVKMLDGIVFQRSAPQLEESGRLSRTQWAGRPHTGCREALALWDTVLDFANRNEENGHHVYAILADVWKAYDCVPWAVLFARLERIGLRTMAKTLQTIYSSLYVTFRTGAGFTDPIKQRNGIAQGMQSSPLAYICFVNPLIAYLANLPGGYTIVPNGRDGRPIPNVEPATVRNVSIMDDLLIVSGRRNDLQQRFSVTVQFGAQNNQFISISKTQCITNDPEGATLEADGRLICPPERQQQRITIQMGDKHKCVRYLGIFRSIADRGSETVRKLDANLYTVLSHLTRKPLPPPLTTTIYHAMVESVFTYFAPWIHIKKGQLTEWENVIHRVIRKAQGLNASTRTILLTHPSVCGFRRLSVVLDATVADTYLQITNSFPILALAVHNNELDFVMRKGNGAHPLFVIEQQFPTLKGTLLGKVQRICQERGLRAMWSKGPMHVRPGDALTYCWTSSNTRSGRNDGRRSDVVSQQCHSVGAIAVSRSVYMSLIPTRIAQMTNPPVQRIMNCPPPNTVPTKPMASALGLIRGRPIPTETENRAWLHWRATFCQPNFTVDPRLLMPPAGNLSNWYPGAIPWTADLLKIAVVPTALFIRRPRGAYIGGGVILICTNSYTTFIPFQPGSSPSVHYTCAIGVLGVLQMTSPIQDLEISTPLEYIQRKARTWGETPLPKRVTCKVRTVMEHVHRILNARQFTRLVTTPTNELSTWNQWISSDIINPNPARWWNHETGGQARDAAKWAARQPLLYPERTMPDAGEPIRLMFMDATKLHNREGKLSRFIYAHYDANLTNQLCNHHELHVYFGRDIHPATWSTILMSKERSLIINARCNLLPIGMNLVTWGFNQTGDRETRCICNWNAANPEYETLEHILFECNMYTQLAGALRDHRISLADALGRLEEVIVTPEDPQILQRALATQFVRLEAVTKIWNERLRVRQAALHPN